MTNFVQLRTEKIPWTTSHKIIQVYNDIVLIIELYFPPLPQYVMVDTAVLSHAHTTRNPQLLDKDLEGDFGRSGNLQASLAMVQLKTDRFISFLFSMTTT